MECKFKKVFFVSVIRTPADMATSTHIMTESLLKGLKENGIIVYFLAICEEESKITDIVDYYQNVVDYVVPLKSVYGVINGNFQQLFAIANNCLFPRKHRNIVLQAIKGLPKPDLIISHSPSFEAIHFALELKKFYKTLLYEYWSDPLALSGINPEEFGVKRYPYYVLEQVAFHYADRIIFGTKTLMQFQKKLYPRYKERMYYIDVPFVHESIKINDTKPNHLIYAGNYFSKIRNIIPLAEAVAKSKRYKLDIYGSGDVDLSGYKNVFVHGRVTPDELTQIENYYKNVVCILNSSCIQIPGKIFYSTNNQTNILVIADGIHQAEILDYLRQYGRYVLCNNTPKNIMEALEKLDEFDYSQFDAKQYSPAIIALQLFDGGVK